jgi:hypothetical protein
MVETGETWTHEVRVQRAGQYRRRHEARTTRLEHEGKEKPAAGRESAAERSKRATVERAMQRASERLRDRNR